MFRESEWQEKNEEKKVKRWKKWRIVLANQIVVMYKDEGGGGVEMAVCRQDRNWARKCSENYQRNLHIEESERIVHDKLCWGIYVYWEWQRLGKEIEVYAMRRGRKDNKMRRQKIKFESV